MCLQTVGTPKKMASYLKNKPDVITVYKVGEISSRGNFVSIWFPYVFHKINISKRKRRIKTQWSGQFYVPYFHCWATRYAANKWAYCDYVRAFTVNKKDITATGYQSSHRCIVARKITMVEV